MKRHLLLVLCIIPVVTLCCIGCDEDDWSGAELDGTRWRLVAWSVSSLHPGDFTITAEFSGGRISGTAAVNLYGGPYSTFAGGGFSVRSLTMTEMAGPEEAMRAEALFVQLLLGTRGYHTLGTELTMRDANNNALLIFTKQ
jgi:heat shock protein HslJ